MNPTSFLARARRRLASSLLGRRLGFPDGHFYSPVASPDELRRDASRIWPAQPTAPGIDFNDASHIDVLSRVFPKFIDDFNYSESTDRAIHPFTFTTKNGQFEGLDPRLLFVVMRSLAPARVIEVGSGFSSLLMADVNCRFLGERTDITCIDPYPRDFLKRGVPGIRRLIEQRVQDVGVELFASLGPQDILFIDSSHVCKTGSDVNFLLLDVLPRLNPGVFVHIHDIFLPFDYHREWVIDEARGWNEQYLLRALLTFSNGFRVRFGVNYANRVHPELLTESLPELPPRQLGGGSFWIERMPTQTQQDCGVSTVPTASPERAYDPGTVKVLESTSAIGASPHSQNEAIPAENGVWARIRDGLHPLLGAGATTGAVDYSDRLLAEQARFAVDLDVHALPDIYHYWSNKFLVEQFRPYGFLSPDSFYCKFLEERINATPGRTARFVSVGAGNCDTEIRLAGLLIEKGYSNFTFECLDINDDMLSRGESLAAESGLAKNFLFTRADFNRWQPQQTYDAVLANHSLHHVEQLELLFDAVRQAIGDEGVFLTSDMIGRNGHMRWPEALELVQEFWADLPESYRYNHQLKRLEMQFEDWDCSVSGFEGIRAQDILPLLIDRFHFSAFFAFANIIDPFIDRSFGHNFVADTTWDQNFIDRVHQKDIEEMRAGRLKPTHVLAAMRRNPTPLELFIPPFTPEFCVRRPE